MVIRKDACARWQVELSHNRSDLPLALNNAPIGEQGEPADRIMVVDAPPSGLFGSHISGHGIGFKQEPPELRVADAIRAEPCIAPVFRPRNPLQPRLCIHDEEDSDSRHLRRLRQSNATAARLSLLGVLAPSSVPVEFLQPIPLLPAHFILLCGGEFWNAPDCVAIRYSPFHPLGTYVFCHLTPPKVGTRPPPRGAVVKKFGVLLFPARLGPRTSASMPARSGKSQPPPPVLEYTKRTKDTTTRIRLRLDRFFGEVEDGGNGKAHHTSVLAGDSDVGAIWAAVIEQNSFTVEARQSSR
jgi:hypothetical protein